jgi:hypothetical protein
VEQVRQIKVLLADLAMETFQVLAVVVVLVH